MHVWEGDPFHSQNFAHSECAKTTYCPLRIGTKPNATPGVLPNFLMMPNLSLALPPRWMAPIEGTGFGFVRHNWLCNSSWLKPNRSTTTELLRRVFCEYSWSILRRNVWSWRDTGSTELSVILRGNKLNLICKFKLETSGRSEGSTIRSAKSQQKGGLHFTLQKTIAVVLYILAICIQVMFSTHVEFSWQNGNLFFCLKNCLGHFRALKPPKRETNMVKTTRATLQHRQIHKSTMIHTQPGRVAAARVCGEQACLPSKATWRKRKIISGPDRGVANHNPCFPKKAANICSWSHEMSHVCK